MQSKVTNSESTVEELREKIQLLKAKLKRQEVLNENSNMDLLKWMVQGKMQVEKALNSFIKTIREVLNGLGRKRTSRQR